MKSAVILSAMLLSFSAHSFERQSSLDLTKILGSADAGQYVIKVKLQSSYSRARGVVSTNVDHNDNDFFCETNATFSVGTMIFTITNTKTGWTQTQSSEVFATASKRVEGTSCDTTLDSFAGKQLVYSQLVNGSPITLPESAPKGFSTVGAHIAPFNGYAYLDANITLENNTLVMNSAGLLSEGSVLSTNNGNSSFTYYVFAQDGARHLSLGSGFVKFE